MWNGKYELWNPVPSLGSARLYVEAVHDDWEGFRVWLRTEDHTKPMIIMRFDPALLYVASNESYRIEPVPSGAGPDSPHPFWKVAESELVDAFSRQSKGIYSNGVIHYALLSMEDCVDVLSNCEPEVTFDA